MSRPSGDWSGLAECHHQSGGTFVSGIVAVHPRPHGRILPYLKVQSIWVGSVSVSRNPPRSDDDAYVMMRRPGALSSPYHRGIAARLRRCGASGTFPLPCHGMITCMPVSSDLPLISRDPGEAHWMFQGWQCRYFRDLLLSWFGFTIVPSCEWRQILTYLTSFYNNTTHYCSKADAAVLPREVHQNLTGTASQTISQERVQVTHPPSHTQCPVPEPDVGCAPHATSPWRIGDMDTDTDRFQTCLDRPLVHSKWAEQKIPRPCLVVPLPPGFSPPSSRLVNVVHHPCPGSLSSQPPPRTASPIPN
ncbi:hypothetical protein N658DRAFT_250354 [Parathielavia hyrcaniae]|uniref:Uncharacterized protein n=1 Tax=Parathielavia hyrcaniae TaxID=113614 RepID=A0AAN6Q667_9PEZI|nr:hypothetical protein N658DRAFT_250354 [Parathielavia hyrcaniae]